MKLNFIPKILALSFTTIGLVNQSQAQMTVTTGETATILAEMLAGEGVEVSGATLSAGCLLTQRGTFAFPEGLSDLGIDTGIVLTTGAVDNGFSSISGAYDTEMSVPATYGASDPHLAALISVPVRDACVLEFDFKPSGDTVKFNYVFASEEYNEYACSSFNDVFGFFISGGAYTTATNIALVPGTTIPVAINTINNAPTPNRFGSFFGSVSTCTSLGAGVPFSGLYIDNENVLQSPDVAYDGFTTVLTAVAAVSPCETYHLKLAIGDGMDGSLDSGVFIEAGSLKSTALSVKTFGGAGLEIPYTNTVRGCPPGSFEVSRDGSTGGSITVEYELLGTAVNGVDYEPLPGSVVIPAGEYSAEVLIIPTILTEAVGPKTVIVNIMSPYVCPGEAPIVLSTDTITILDSLYVKVEQNDTAICIGESLTMLVTADSLVDLIWTPAGAVLPDPTAREITITPTTTTTYTATVSILGVACPTASDNVLIQVKSPPAVTFAEEIMMCLDGSVSLEPIITPEPDGDFSFIWTPATGLDDPTALNPNASPTISTDYTIEVNPGAEGCSGFATVRVTVLPNDIILVNNDTAVCAGTSIALNASGHPVFSYYWTPEDHIENPHAMNTAITATESGTITVIASHPGCDDMIHSFYLDVQPIPDVNLGPDLVLCSGDTAQLFASTIPEYAGYAYDWNPGAKLSDSTIKNPVFVGFSSETYILDVTTPIGCKGSDTIAITVNRSDFGSVNITDTNLCPPVMVQLEASGGVSYRWEPSYGLDNDSIPNPVATPDYTTNYLLYATSDEGCVDIIPVNINVNNDAVVTLSDSVHIWPGESYEIDMTTNTHYFSWFPPEGLSNTTIANPIASPEVRTRYYVTATTEGGCSTVDSIDVIVHLESVFDIPNAFAPGNSFGSNSNFKIARRGDVTLDKFEIFNRWGNKVYSSSDIDEGWDGRYNDQPQPMGVYVYMIEATLNTGRKIQLSGNVTLVR